MSVSQLQGRGGRRRWRQARAHLHLAHQRRGVTNTTSRRALQRRSLWRWRPKALSGRPHALPQALRPLRGRRRALRRLVVPANGRLLDAAVHDGGDPVVDPLLAILATLLRTENSAERWWSSRARDSSLLSIPFRRMDGRQRWWQPTRGGCMGEAGLTVICANGGVPLSASPVALWRQAFAATRTALVTAPRSACACSLCAARPPPLALAAGSATTGVNG